jgi:predicted hydrocarbon binding protein/voltage-gated potassium channel Kch
LKNRLFALLQNPFIISFLGLLLVIPLSTLFYMRQEGWNFLTALIFVLETVTTVGYGNVFPHHHAAQIFTAVLLLIGIGVVITALATFSGHLIRLILKGANPMEKNERALAALSDHIVIAAEDNLANLLSQNLRVKELPFVLITQDEAILNRWLEQGTPVVFGNPDDETVLRKAGIERAAGLIVALTSDADNVFVSLSAHDLNPTLRIVARAHNPSSIAKLRRSGADEVILPEQVTAINLVDFFRSREWVGNLVQQITGELREELGSYDKLPSEQQGHTQQLLFRALRLALLELSPDMESTLYALGTQFGREAMGPHLPQGSLCQALEKLSDLWLGAGLGQLRVVQCAKDAAVVEEGQCSTCENLPNVGRTVCHLERGVLAGALEIALGRTARVQETKCLGLGDQFCQFEISSDIHPH